MQPQTCQSAGDFLSLTSWPLREGHKQCFPSGGNPSWGSADPGWVASRSFPLKGSTCSPGFCRLSSGSTTPSQRAWGPWLLGMTCRPYQCLSFSKIPEMAERGVWDSDSLEGRQLCFFPYTPPTPQHTRILMSHYPHQYLKIYQYLTVLF